MPSGSPTWGIGYRRPLSFASRNCLRMLIERRHAVGATFERSSPRFCSKFFVAVLQAVHCALVELFNAQARFALPQNAAVVSTVWRLRCRRSKIAPPDPQSGTPGFAGFQPAKRGIKWHRFYARPQTKTVPLHLPLRSPGLKFDGSPLMI